MDTLTKMRIEYKYWCPPLWVKGLIELTHNLYRSINPRYPLSDPANSLSCAPLFIISAGRSGTTLLRSMLVAGDSIAIPPESQIIQNIAVKFRTRQGLGWEGLSQSLVAEFERRHNFNQWKSNLAPVYQTVANLPDRERSLARLIDEVYKGYGSQNFPNALMWGDQSPIYTFFLPYITKIFPNAKYIHLLRDGRDAVASFVEKDGQDFFMEGIYRWKESVKRARRLQNQLGPKNFLEIRYEDLVTETEATLRIISQFLGLEYKAKMLDYWKLDSTVESKYYDFHRNIEIPVFASSIGSWKKRLSAEQIEILLKNTSDLLTNLGYL
jgi:protein-tyrosine sulfotransferase